MFIVHITGTLKPDRLSSWTLKRLTKISILNTRSLESKQLSWKKSKRLNKKCGKILQLIFDFLEKDVWKEKRGRETRYIWKKERIRVWVEKWRTLTRMDFYNHRTKVFCFFRDTFCLLAELILWRENPWANVSLHSLIFLNTSWLKRN